MMGCVAGCAGVKTADETPVINVSYFHMLPSRGIAPEFEIGLQIINPGGRVLELKGIAYTVSLEGHRVLVGVADDLPVINPYNQADVIIRASTDMLSSIRLLTDLMSRNRDTFSYEFSAKLDIGGQRRRINVVRQGEVTLSGRQD
jgi:LEA14-like dessication related protein